MQIAHNLSSTLEPIAKFSSHFGIVHSKFTHDRSRTDSRESEEQDQDSKDIIQDTVDSHQEQVRRTRATAARRKKERTGDSTVLLKKDV